MATYISPGMWNAGKTLAGEGKVRKVERVPSEDGQVTLRAHVTGAFGFVHHPMVRFDPAGAALTGFACDCQNGTKLCVHCAALLAEEYGDQQIRIEADARENRRFSGNAMPLTDAKGPVAASPDRAVILSDTLWEPGMRTVKGKVKCDFGFTHYPELVFHDGELVDMSCDCYHTSSRFRPCPHCELLLDLLGEKGPGPIDSHETEEPVRPAGEDRENDLTDTGEEKPVYRFPAVDFLDEPVVSDDDAIQDELTATKERLELCLRSFGINVNISNIVHGPSITRYEMELEIGVKLNKLTNLADDIALALGVSGVRIAAIPNRISTVGIEVPNKNVSTVYLREIITAPEFTNAKSKLTFAIGKNISGDVMVGNISKLPHLLVAGTTGSGKSVCLNSLILSLLYKATPEEVKFIMVDPKMVEFKIYNGIPHLLIPVVTEAKKAAGALQWAVVEMMKRYRTFSDAGARDISSYNQQLDADTPKMPQIVIIIDELADLMMIAAKEVEESICRVAQMGRAAGVHLVIATQSPRADVITGLMKANIPSRIALKVASSLESRIILDAGGAADKLVGNGDMLFAPIGASKPARIQGAWVSDEEREQIVAFIKRSYKVTYSENVIQEIEKAVRDREDNVANAQLPHGKPQRLGSKAKNEKL